MFLVPVDEVALLMRVDEPADAAGDFSAPPAPFFFEERESAEIELEFRLVLAPCLRLGLVCSSRIARRRSDSTVFRLSSVLKMVNLPIARRPGEKLVLRGGEGRKCSKMATTGTFGSGEGCVKM